MRYTVNEAPLSDRKQTSDEIFRLVRQFASDLNLIKIPTNTGTEALSKISFEDYYDFVRKLPYKRDVAPIERVGRPRWIIDEINTAGRGIDCKKKSVLIAAWLHLHGIPYRFIGSSNRADRQIHHIFPQADFGNGWINVDATYKNYRISQVKKVTEMEVL